MNRADTDQVRNALHAAATWLERIAAPAGAVAVVTVWPKAAVGLWIPGKAAVVTLPAIDDPAAEVADAVAPVVEHTLMQRLAEPARGAVVRAVDGGARLQVLVAPTLRGITLRVASDAGAVEVARVELEDVPA